MRKPFSDISVERTRTLTRNARMPFPNGIRIEEVKALAGQWVISKAATSNEVLLYLHGGGYVQNTPHVHQAMVARICRAANIRALYVDYRLAPEFPFPAALDDTLAAYQWLLDQHVPSQNIIFGGDSAGGGLAVAAMIKLRELGLPLPVAGILLSPWCDLELNTEAALADRDPIYARKAFVKFGHLYAENTPLDHPLLSPIHADLTNLPPLFIQAGELELLLDDARQLADHVRNVGGSVDLSIYPGMWHVWQVYPPFMVPESRLILHLWNGHPVKTETVVRIVQG